MAQLPDLHTTVTAIYRAYEAQADSGWRPHLGASVIGRPCRRDLWYGFRWAVRPEHGGRLLRLFRRGQREEAEFVADLRRIGVEVHEMDPSTGRQFRFTDVGGHVGGAMDGAGRGLVEAPQTWHVLEFKTHNAKSFKALISQGVRQAKPEHWAQMQLYMHWSGMRRAYYLGVSKDDDQLYGERVRYDAAAAQELAARARAVVTAPEPLERLSEDPTHYQCGWCSHRAVCHEGAMPEVHCRTCAHSTPELDGDGRWSCAYWQADIPLEAQRQGCTHHVYIPALLPWALVDADPAENWAEYRLPDGRTVRNGDGHWASAELRAAPGVAGDEVVEELRQVFGARIVTMETANP